MGFSLSLTGKEIRRSILVFFALSCVLPILLVLVIVYIYVIPAITPDQISQLDQVFAYGISAMLLIAGLGFLLLSQWIGGLEKFSRELKSRMSLLTGQEREVAPENEIAALELIFQELEKLTRDLRSENAERLIAETALQQSTERYQSLIRNIPIGLYRTTIDSKGRFVMANPAIARMFGYDSVEEFLQLTVADLYSDPEQRKSFTAKILAAKRFVSEVLQLKKKDGSLIWGSVRLNVTLDPSGRIQFIDGSIEDVTQQKVTEEALIKNEKVYRSFAEIGMALSIEKNISKLLEMIVESARELSYADAGTLYIIDDDEQHLRFEILQNDTLRIRMGGTSNQQILLPKVPLYLEGKPNFTNVSSYVALTDKTVNIEDVYEVEGFDFTGPKNYDLETGYRSKSMLVVPMKNHENQTIGVLQLLNAKDPKSGEFIPFSGEYVDLISSLASQAAVALTNTRLIHDLDSLLNAFIKSIATGIDEKSPYTGGHIKRVVDLSTMIAEKINQSDKEPFQTIHFSQDQMNELRMAAWMHDVGKIATPELVVDKATKLSALVDRIDVVALRFEIIEKILEIKTLQRKNELLRDGKGDLSLLEILDNELAAEKDLLRKELAFLREVNLTGDYHSDEKVERVNRIGSRTYTVEGKELGCLTPDEIENLNIRKGTLTERERRIIEEHARITTKILSQLPFPKKLAGVPRYAGEHHEKLDGSGYHQGLEAKDLSLQSRIIAFADIFEALTAKDRPYRKPMQLSQAVKILNFMKKDRHIDPDVYAFFISEDLIGRYAEKEMSSDQIDQTRFSA